MLSPRCPVKRFLGVHHCSEHISYTKTVCLVLTDDFTANSWIKHKERAYEKLRYRHHRTLI